MKSGYRRIGKYLSNKQKNCDFFIFCDKFLYPKVKIFCLVQVQKNFISGCCLLKYLAKTFFSCAYKVNVRKISTYH